MAIITKPALIYKDQENVYSLSIAELLLHSKVSPDPYFNNPSNWDVVFIVYEAIGSNQRENVEFEVSESQTTGLFEITGTGRENWEIQALIIQDFDKGYLRIEREDLDFNYLDFTIAPPPIAGPPVLNFVNISPVIANVNNSEVITLSFTSVEPLQNVSATIAGQTASISGSGSSWTASYMLTGIESAGLVNFTINFQDLQSEQGVTVTNTTDSSTTTIEYNQETLTTVSITSTSGVVATEGDTVTVSFASADIIQNVTSTIVGKTASVSNTGGNDWEASYILQASETQGIVSFTIDFEDQYGNPQTQVISVTDASQVVVDTLLPTLSPVTIASNNTNTAEAIEGDTVTLSFTSSEALQNVSATIIGQPATISGAGTNWTASYVVQSGDPEAVVPFTIDFDDVNSNSGATVSSTTNGSLVTVVSAIICEDVLEEQWVAFLNSSGMTQSTRHQGQTYKHNTDHTICAVELFVDKNNNPSADLKVEIWNDSNETILHGTSNLISTLSLIGNGPVKFLFSTPVTGLLTNITYYIKVSYSNPITIDSSNYIGLRHSTSDVYPSGVWYSNGVAFPTRDLAFKAYGTETSAPPPTPELPIVTISASNGSPADAGDIVTLSFTSDEAINTPTVSILSNNVIPTNTGGNNWQAQYTVLGTDPETVVPFTIDFESTLGEQGVQVTSTTNGSSVTIEFPIVPIELTSVHIESNNVDPTIAETGDVITLSFTSDAPIIIPVNGVRIKNHVVAATNTSGNNWEATYTLQALDQTGFATILIQYRDLLLVDQPIVGNTTDGSSVYIDSWKEPLLFVYDNTFSFPTNTFSAGPIVDIDLGDDDSVFGAGPSVVSGGAVARNTFKIEPNGSLVNSYNATAGIPGVKFSNSPTVVKVQQDQKIILGGFFLDYAGFSGRDALIRLHPDGTLDTSFCINASDGSKFNNVIWDISVQDDGKILVGGNFTDYGGTVGRSYLVRLNSNGTLDTTFCQNIVDGKFSGSIYKTYQQTNGKLLIGGNFDNYGGVPDNDALIRLNSNDTLDTAFNQKMVDILLGGNCEQIIESSGGDLVVGGTNFDNNGVSESLIRLGQDGTYINEITSIPTFSIIYDIVIYPNDRLVVAIKEGNTLHFGLWRCNLSGSGGEVATSIDFNKAARSMHIESGGKLIVSGLFDVGPEELIIRLK